jgi:hypothetical protein
MKSTPIHDELKVMFDDVAKSAQRRGRLEAQIELMQYIKAGLEDKTISKSLGVTKIIEWLRAQQ